jgi:hypothetical protein
MNVDGFAVGLWVTKFLIALATTVALVGPAPAATESMLPTGFLGDWCVTRSDERNTPPPWS